MLPTARHAAAYALHCAALRCTAPPSAATFAAAASHPHRHRGCSLLCLDVRAGTHSAHCCRACLQLQATLIGSSTGDGLLRCVFILPGGVSWRASLAGLWQMLPQHDQQRAWCIFGQSKQKTSRPPCPHLDLFPCRVQEHANLKTAADYQRYLEQVFPSLPSDAVQVKQPECPSSCATDAGWQG